uniref:HNH endonuclease family protein n=1 Tax=Marinobacter sp. TaxID=50741 RepID=UPI003A904C51
SPHYERTSNYEAFGSIQSCIQAGGRLPKNLSNYKLLAKAESAGQSVKSGYERNKFGYGWDDADGDCQDSRAEALISSSTTTVRFADERRCRVTTGRWISMFSGKVIQNASDIDIDHVVPLKWAWDHGADSWPKAKREKFANDPVNLVPVEASLNRSKGAQGPEDWLPPAGQCQYVSRFMRIMRAYGLRPSEGQFHQYKQLLADYCG